MSRHGSDLGLIVENAVNCAEKEVIGKSMRVSETSMEFKGTPIQLEISIH